MAEYDLIDLYRSSMRRRLNQAEVDWLVAQQQHYPYLPLPQAMLARQEGNGDPLFRAAVYAPERNQLRQYIKGRLFWSGPDYFVSDSVRMSEEVVSPTVRRHCPPFFSIATQSAPRTQAADQAFELIQPPKAPSHFHPYLDQICRELGQQAGRIRAQLRQQWSQPRPTQSSTSAGDVAWPSSYFPSSEPVEADQTTRQRKAKQLIDRFLSASPQLARPKPSPAQEEPEEHLAAQTSNAHDDTLATETLAKLYLRQGDRAQARRVYEQLRLRFPEKSDYFDAQIKKLS
jgi:hypothetical protein